MKSSKSILHCSIDTSLRVPRTGDCMELEWLGEGDFTVSFSMEANETAENDDTDICTAFDKFDLIPQWDNLLRHLNE